MRCPFQAEPKRGWQLLLGKCIWGQGALLSPGWRMKPKHPISAVSQQRCSKHQLHSEQVKWFCLSGRKWKCADQELLEAQEGCSIPVLEGCAGSLPLLTLCALLGWLCCGVFWQQHGQGMPGGGSLDRCWNPHASWTEELETAKINCPDRATNKAIRMQ